MYIVFIVYIITLIFSTILVVWLLDMVRVAVCLEAPLVSTPPEIIGRIDEALGIGAGAKVYELGCGDARILCALSLKHPDANFFGVDKLAYAILLAKLKIRKHGLKNVHVRQADMYKTDLTSATHIFLWIYPHMMDRLLPKLKAELKQGAVVVAMDFGFKNLLPNKTLDLKYKKKRYAQRLLVYYFLDSHNRSNNKKQIN